MFRANFCPSSGAQDWVFFTTYGIVSCCCGRQGFGARQRGTTCTVWRKQLPSYRTRSATLPCSEPLPTTTTGHYTICCKKNSVLRSWRWAKVCPKHVELILEINKTVIVASRWFLYIIYLHWWSTVKHKSSLRFGEFLSSFQLWMLQKRAPRNLLMCVFLIFRNYEKRNRFSQNFVPWNFYTTVPRRLTTGIHYEKCVVRRFRRCGKTYTYTDLDSIVYYTPRRGLGWRSG